MYMVCNKLIAQHQKTLQFLRAFLSGLAMGITLVKLLFLFNLIDFSSKKYVYVDIEKVITAVNQAITKQVEEKLITDDKVPRKLDLAKNKFNYLLGNYVKERNAIVFSSSKAIAGADNVTEYFIDKTLESVK